MSITKESYFKLVKLSELSKLNRNTSIQVIGKILSYDKMNQKLQIDDTFSTLSIDIGKKLDITLKVGQVIRAFGSYDGIKILIEKIIDWPIEPEKIPILFTGL